MKTLEKTVSTVEAAKILAIRGGSRGVSRLCLLGKLKPAYKISDAWRIPVSTIEKYLEECSNENS